MGVGHVKKVQENPSLRKEWKEKKKQNISCHVNKDLLICLFHSFGLVYIFLTLFSRQEQSYALEIKDKMQPQRIISQMMLGGKKPSCY